MGMRAEGFDEFHEALRIVKPLTTVRKPSDSKQLSYWKSVASRPSDWLDPPTPLP